MNELNYSQIVEALLTGRTSEIDNFFRAQPEILNELRVFVRNKMDTGEWVTPDLEREYYRGILLSDAHAVNRRLKPISHIKTISFTENIEQAKIFADTSSAMSSLVMQFRPSSKGYIIRYSPVIEDILFHYSWLTYILPHLFYGNLDLSLIAEQEELILFNNMRIFDLEEFSKYD